MISGSNFQNGTARGEGSYYFSRYCSIWGWAGWRRAWQDYDVDLKNWPSKRDSFWLQSQFRSPKEIECWHQIFQSVFEKKIDTWDYQWLYTNIDQGRFTIVPNKNLISNIGFDLRATHTKKPSIFANMRTSALNFPLDHPTKIISNTEADNYLVKTHLTASIVRKIFNLVMGTKKTLLVTEAKKTP